ncbi:MAG: MFS transporter [Dehalococcoidia bacterium]|nr:MFS transporter [Dehalococcoidia bacterium]
MTLSPRPAALPGSRRMFYGWYITFGGALNNFLLSAISVWGFGVFIRPLRDEFGWSSAVIAAGFSIRSFQQGFLAPFVGIVIDRLGPRAMVFAGTIVLAAGFLLFAVTQSIPMYFAASLLIALGQSIGSFTAFTAVLMRWFSVKRGRAIGVLNAGNGAGYFLVPGIAFIVSAAGWRPALVVCAALILLIGLPIAFIVRDDPADLGLNVDGVASDASLGEVDGQNRDRKELTGATVAEALHMRAFYLLAFAQAIGGGAVNVWLVHAIPHLENVGFSLGAATAIGVGFAICQIAFRPLGGVLGDRIGRRRLFGVGFVFVGLGMVVFSLLTSDRLWLLPLYYATFAVGQAAWVVLQAATIADYFGPRRFATISGLANLMQMPVGVVAPIIAGWAFDRSGTYTPVFLVFAVGPLLSALCVALAPAPTRTVSLVASESAA